MKENYNKEELTINDVKDYLNQHKEEEITRRQVAEYFHMHPDYLSRIFKEKTGMALMEYVFELRMNEARRLLLETRFSIGQISEKTGYLDASYFSYLFKRNFGMTPREFRKKAGWENGENE